jgi:recombinational DNA repair ATPase RecF
MSIMSVEQLEQTVLKLSPDERRRFLDWLYEHEDELLGPGDDIHPEVKAEILRRREEALAHPEKLEAWESAFPRMKQRFDELRLKNPYAR